MGRTYRLLGDSLVHASRAVRLLHLHVGSIPLVLLGSLTAREPGLDSFEHVGRSCDRSMNRGMILAGQERPRENGETPF